VPLHKPFELGNRCCGEAYKALTREKPQKPVKESKGGFDGTTPMGQAILKFDMRAYLTAREISWWERNNKDQQIRIEYSPGHSSLDWSDEFHSSRYWRDAETMNLLDTLTFVEMNRAGKEYKGFSALEKNEKQAIKGFLEKYSGVSLDPKLKLVEKHKIRVWDKDELKNANIPDLVELIEGVMSDEGVYLFAGQDKAGKSLLGMNLALSIASDRPTFLTWNIKKHRSCSLLE